MAARTTAALLQTFISITVAVQASSKIDCNDGKFYIRADPDSCSHFYKCDNGKPVRFTCPDNLYFNPTIYVCDWPYNVKCGVNSESGQSSSNSKGGNNSNQVGQYNEYNNNQGQYVGNNQGGQNSGYNNQGGQSNGNNNQGGQYSAYNRKENQGKKANNNKNGSDDAQTPHYVIKGVPEEGPSVQDPHGPLQRPRPTVDDDQSAAKNYYTNYEEDYIDIR